MQPTFIPLSFNVDRKVGVVPFDLFANHLISWSFIAGVEDRKNVDG